MPLTALQIKNEKPSDKPRNLFDGGGLYLRIEANGAKYWRLKCQIDGKEARRGIGVYCKPTLQGDGRYGPEKIIMSLAEAREAADEYRRNLASGKDPKKQKEEARQVSDSNFQIVALEWHSKNAPRWVPDHAERIRKRLVESAFPLIGGMDVKDITTADLLAVLRPVEADGKLDTASRLRQYLTGIMRYAVQTGRIRSNPALDLQGALTAPKSAHRPALPLNRLPELIAAIDQYKGRKLTQAALWLTLLTFIRSSELRFMRWDEIDFEREVWTIPPEREAIEGVKHSTRGAKMRSAHVVPLSKPALQVLESLKPISGGFPLVFTGDHDPNKPMSENTINKALRVLGFDTKTEVCGHGFRAMACSALTESGLWEVEIIEKQMSHEQRNSVRAAYIHKAEHLTQRKAMMAWWADYLNALRGGGFVEPVEFAAKQ